MKSAPRQQSRHSAPRRAFNPLVVLERFLAKLQIVTCVALALSTGCSPTVANSALPKLPAFVARSPKALNHLYVADAFNNAVTVYKLGSIKLERQITKEIHLPTSLAIDAAGNLFVGGKYITAYAPKSGNPTLTISKSVSNPYALAFDSAGNIYAANSATIIGSYCACGNVTVYSTKSGKLIRTLKAWGPTALTFDSSGDLYVATNVKSGVSIYRPNAEKPFKTLVNGIAGPLALALDRATNLYVANAQSVTVYSAKTHALVRTITDGIVSPRSLAFDGNGNLYVANTGGANTVTVYGPGGRSPIRAIKAGIHSPQKLLYAYGNLYVANARGSKGSKSTITVYRNGAGTPIRVISSAIREPMGLALGP